MWLSEDDAEECPVWIEPPAAAAATEQPAIVAAASARAEPLGWPDDDATLDPCLPTNTCWVDSSNENDFILNVSFLRWGEWGAINYNYYRCFLVIDFHCYSSVE